MRENCDFDVVKQAEEPVYFVDFLREPVVDKDTGEIVNAHPSFYEAVPGGLPDVRARVEVLRTTDVNDPQKQVRFEDRIQGGRFSVGDAVQLDRSIAQEPLWIPGAAETAASPSAARLTSAPSAFNATFRADRRPTHAHPHTHAHAHTHTNEHTRERQRD